MKRLMIKRGRSYVFIKLDSINWVEREGNYLRIHTDDNSFLFRETLSAFEQILPEDNFIRINRSIIVNLEFIKELQIADNSAYTVVMRNNVQQSWGRKYRSNLNKIAHISRERCL